MNTMKKKVFVMIYPQMADFEMILACTSIANSDKYTIVPIADSLSPIVAQSGHTYIPQQQLKEIQITEQVAGILIPGGSEMIPSREFLKLIQQAHSQNKMVAAICIGPEYLATAGILKGKKYTSSMQPEYYANNQKDDPFEWENQTNTRVWVEDNIITAKGEAFVDFALRIWEYLKIMTPEELENERDEFTPEWCR